MRKFVILITLLVVLAVPGFAVVAQDDAGPTVLDILAGDPRFDTLLSAVVAAQLADDLADPTASFTVFAPTDDAFTGDSGRLYGVACDQ